MNIRIDVNSKTLLSVLLLCVVVLLIIKLQAIITVFAVSFFISYVLMPFVTFIENRFKMNRLLAVGIIFILFFSVITVIMLFLVPFLYAEGVKLISNVPQYIQIITQKLDALAGKYGYDFGFDSIKDFVITRFNTYSKEMFSSTLQIAGSVIGFIFSLVGLFIIPILVFYFLKDFEMIFKNIIDIATKKTGVDLYYYNNEFNSILKKYFRGQFFVCVILAFLYGTVDLVVGIKGGFFIGFVAGLLSFIPYLGFISGIVSSLIISYVQFGDILHPFFVVIGFGAVQMIESYLLTPKLIGESLGLHPTAVIFAVLAGGYLLGIGGIILSIPLAAFIKIIGSKLLEQI